MLYILYGIPTEKETYSILCQRIVLTWISYNSQRIRAVQSCKRLKFTKYKKNEKWTDSSSSNPNQRLPRYKPNWTVRPLTSNEKHINCVIVVLSKRCLQGTFIAILEFSACFFIDSCQGNNNNNFIYPIYFDWQYLL